jgi:putative endopeptidase
VSALSRGAAAALVAVLSAASGAAAQAIDENIVNEGAVGDLVPLFAAPAAAATASGEAAPAPAYGAWGFDLSGMDTGVKPGDDFFGYANGRWFANATIPADKSRVGMFDALTDKTQDRVLAIVEDLGRSGAAAGTPAAKISALYKAYMDEARLDELDAAPIASDLAEIRAAKSLDDIARLMGRGRSGFGASFFFASVNPDEKDPAHHAAYLAQSGLGLPDRDYYLKDTFKVQLTRYREYVERVLGMIGWTDPHGHAGDIVGLETRIAEASWSRVESRDRDKTYNAMTPAELAAHAPDFPWPTWLTASDIGGAGRLVVRQNSAFPKLAKIFAATPLETLQAWQAFRVVDQAAPYLSKRFAQTRFQFRNGVLVGQPEERPRTKRAVGVIDGALGDAVGQEYVTRYFPPQSKARMEALVGQLMAALHARIEHLTWMSPETKAKALEKLALFNVKIGYPTVWRDYSTLAIDPADLMGDIRRSNAFRWAYAVGHLGRPVDPEEWFTMPQVVNAYYSATRAEIVFPAAILQPPFFDPEADVAVNYGGIGGVIGHELTHGFDDQGRKSDGHGLLVDWWQPADAAKFQAEAAKLGAQYDAYAVAPGLNVKGAQTMGENIADLGGLLLALDAYRASLKGEPAAILDGFSGEQRVFLGWAQVWRAKLRPEAAKQQVSSDAHAPARFRVDGPVRNVDGWYDAWGIKPGDRLYLRPEDRVRIW